MLPDYPRLKKKLNNKFAEMIKQDIKKDSFLGNISNHLIHEGNVLKTKSIDGFSSITDYPEIASEFAISLDETNREGPRALLSKRAELSKDMIRKLTKQFEDRINDVTERTGNVVKVDGRNQSSNPLIDMLETEVEVDFDENGTPIMPTIFPLQGIEVIKTKLKECQNDPEMAKRLKQLIEKKRKEWLDRENSRKLVD